MLQARWPAVRGAGGATLLLRGTSGVSVPVMRTVYRAETLIDAHLVKDALEAQAIPAFIAGEYLTGGVGQLPATDFIAVMVPTSSLPQAEAIVRAVEASLREVRGVLDEGDGHRDDPLDACPA